jgi:glycosyltransferase involved in cell wall biosynthesis
LKSAAKKRIIVSVTSDLVSDNRVHKVCSTLARTGFQVTLAGRMLPGSLKLEGRIYSTRRFRLPFAKGPMFYAAYNVRLFVYIMFSKYDVLLSNDLDTLPANFLISKLKKKPLIYDSHEYFTQVPELVRRPKVQRIWEWMERKMVPDVDAAYTVCNSIAEIYTKKYGVPFQVVRNLPLASDQVVPIDDEDRDQIIIYQGAVNEGRGLEQAIRAVKFLDGIRLVIAGDGDKRKILQKLAVDEGVSDKVEFRGRLPIHQLAELTRSAAVGLSIEEDIGLNYHFALPNKLFDYIQAQVPVLVTDLPEMLAVVNGYEIGEVISDLNPRNLAAVLADMVANTEKRKLWKKNLKQAARELVWEKEERILYEIFNPFL